MGIVRGLLWRGVRETQSNGKIMVFVCILFIHGEKLFVNFTFFIKKIHYFYSDAGTHSKCRIFTILNSTF